VRWCELLRCGRRERRTEHVVVVNRTRNGTCVNRVVLVLWKERAMYGGTSWALSPERASANMKMGKNLGQNTRGHQYITVPDSCHTGVFGVAHCECGG
jgi:hypothetical protein